MPTNFGCKRGEFVTITIKPTAKGAPSSVENDVLVLSVVRGDGTFVPSTDSPFDFHLVPGPAEIETVYNVKGDADRRPEVEKFINKEVTLAVAEDDADDFDISGSAPKPISELPPSGPTVRF